MFDILKIIKIKLQSIGIDSNYDIPLSCLRLVNRRRIIKIKRDWEDYNVVLERNMIKNYRQKDDLVLNIGDPEFFNKIVKFAKCKIIN